MSEKTAVHEAAAARHEGAAKSHERAAGFWRQRTSRGGVGAALRAEQARTHAAYWRELANRD
jgi:hypothetical protein